MWGIYTIIPQEFPFSLVEVVIPSLILLNHVMYESVYVNDMLGLSTDVLFKILC